MPAIAVIDDRKSDRDTIGKVVRSILKKLKEDDKWAVILDDPPVNEHDILPWLDEHGVAVLVTDWKLNEGAKGKRVVNYEADRLIREIRVKRPTFPIFVITGFAGEARVYLKDVENIFKREEFTKDAETIIPQILRAGLRRYEEQREVLGRMDVLARKVATSRASKKERAELSGIDGYFQADLPAVLTLESVVADLEPVLKKAEKLRHRVEKRIAAKASKKSS